MSSEVPSLETDSRDNDRVCTWCIGLGMVALHALVGASARAYLPAWVPCAACNGTGIDRTDDDNRTATDDPPAPGF